MRRWLVVLLCFVWVVAALAAGPAVRLGRYLLLPLDRAAGPQAVDVPVGAGPLGLAKLLQEKKIIAAPRLFALAMRLNDQSRRIRAGAYALSAAQSPWAIMDILANEPPQLRRLTVLEGHTIYDVANRLAEAGLMGAEDFLAEAEDPETAAALNLEGPGVEGYLFPETYYFPQGVGAREIVRVMVQRFLKTFDELERKARASGRPATGLSRRETVILASLVEAETPAAAERPLVAGVFMNRLRRNMLLQSDPTVSYGLSEPPRRLRKSHLKDPHRYNTYVHPGLPPGPIGNPGASALRAALAPEKTNYVYFVSKNDGTHHFSVTYDEHLQAVNRYQRR